MFLCSWVFLGIAGKSYRWQYISCSSIFETILNGLTTLGYTGVSHFLRQIKVICKGPKIISQSLQLPQWVIFLPDFFCTGRFISLHALQGYKIASLSLTGRSVHGAPEFSCSFSVSFSPLLSSELFSPSAFFSSSFSSSLFFASLATATDFFIGGGLSNLSELLTIEPQGFF